MIIRRMAPALAVAGLILAFAGCGGGGSSSKQTRFSVVRLVADQGGQAAQTDGNLVNAWGMAVGTVSIWISENGTDKSAVYKGDVNGSALVTDSLVVNIPGGKPTGQVFNDTNDFVVTQGVASGPSAFIFASEGGQITGWNPAVPAPPPSTNAQPAVTVPGAVFKGLAIGNNGSNHLYATDFAGGTIKVFNSTFAPVALAGTFTDPTIPAGFSPFNIQNLNGTLYVTYAKKEAGGDDDEPGPGNGFVDRFDLNGNFLGRLVSHGRLNSPWGLAIAPNSFGDFAGALLVGNFGDGWINAYNPTTGVFLGSLKDSGGSPIAIEGLWGIAVGNGVTAGDNTALYFTAGPGDENHGLFGKIVVAP